MPIPTWVSGQVLTASDVNAWFVPLFAYKGSDQSKTSNTTMGNDTALVLAAAINTSWKFECFIDYDGGTQGSSDIKWQFTVPAGATMRYYYAGLGTAGGTLAAWSNAGNVQTAGTNGLGTHRVIYMNGTYVMSGTAGNLQLQWAQNTSSGTATTVYTQSYLQLWRVA